jgi:hypothetical protein
MGRLCRQPPIQPKLKPVGRILYAWLAPFPSFVGPAVLIGRLGQRQFRVCVTESHLTAYRKLKNWRLLTVSNNCSPNVKFDDWVMPQLSCPHPLHVPRRLLGIILSEPHTASTNSSNLAPTFHLGSAFSTLSISPCKTWSPDRWFVVLFENLCDNHLERSLKYAWINASLCVYMDKKLSGDLTGMSETVTDVTKNLSKAQFWPIPSPERRSEAYQHNCSTCVYVEVMIIR